MALWALCYSFEQLMEIIWEMLRVRRVRIWLRQRKRRLKEVESGIKKILKHDRQTSELGEPIAEGPKITKRVRFALDGEKYEYWLFWGGKRRSQS